MIAAASPGSSENDTSDRTASAPAGPGYSLLRCETFSMRCESGGAAGTCRQRGTHLEKPIGGVRDVVIRADALESALAERSRLPAVLPQLEQRVAERFWIVRMDQQAAASPLDDLGESAAARLHYRHAARHCLQQEHSFRLVVGRRHRQRVERLQKSELAVAVDCAAIGELREQPGRFQPALYVFEIRRVGAAQISGCFQPDIERGSGALAKVD